MKRQYLGLILLAACSGCASYSQMMVRDDGDIQRCAAYGQGLIGMNHAQTIQGDCISSLKSAGYMEIENAGAIGIYVGDQPTDALSIVKVWDNSPAAKAGIRPGDKLVRVNGQKVKNKKDAGVLMFGPAGTKITLGILRDDRPSNYDLVRSSFTAVYGTSQVAAK